MVERIRLLLETRQLTPTQFADAIGIARPIVSHILSGRNKPSLEVVQRILAAMPDLSMPWLLNGTGTMQAAVANTLPPPVAVALVQPDSQIAEKEDFVPYAAAVSPAPPPTVVATLPRRNVASPGPAPISAPVTATLPGPKRFASPPKAAPAPTPAALVAELPSPTLQASPQSGPAQDSPPATPQLQPLPENKPLNAPASAPEIASVAPVPSIAAALFAGAEKPIRRIVIFYRDGSFADYQPE